MTALTLDIYLNSLTGEPVLMQVIGVHLSTLRSSAVNHDCPYLGCHDLAQV
jgi:hypothetical protein